MRPPEKLPGFPWTADEAMRLAGMVGAGAVVCTIAWAVASSRPSVGSQVDMVSLGVGGLVLAMFGQASWLLRGRRAVGARARHLLGAGPPVPVHEAAGRGEAGVLVGGPGLRWYHRADCQLARGRDLDAAGRAEHEACGRSPCGVCRP